MEWFQVFTLVAVHLWISTATKILYVIPDNSTNATICLSYSCATLNQYLLDNKNSLPVISNVQYYFLPGEHPVPPNMVLENLHNFSIIGITTTPSSPVVLVGCLQLYVINIINSYNVTIANVQFQQRDQIHLSKYKYSTNLLIESCHSCTIEKVVFMNLGLKGTNVIGNSYFTEIVIKADRVQPNFLVFCQGITLNYWDKQPYTDNKHLLIMNQINISSNKCYNSDPIGMDIVVVNVIGNLIIIIQNSWFYNLDYTAVSIKSRCFVNNSISIENCSFEHNIRTYFSEEFLPTVRPLIIIILSYANKSISFKQCSFRKNYNNQHLIFILIKRNRICSVKTTHCIGPTTNVTLVKCQFTENKGELINIRGAYCRANLLIIGLSCFANTTFHHYVTGSLLSFSNMTVHMIGPVIISSNYAQRTIHFISCDVVLHKNILLKLNSCDQVITLQFTCIKLMENTNITLLKNRYLNKLIETEHDNEYRLYPLCIFQFLTLRNLATVSPMNYSVNIIDNSYIIKGLSANIERQKKCSFPYYHFTPHCQWIPNAAFHEYSPRVIYQQVIKSHGQSLIYHEICHCPQNGSDNCSVDTLGPVYPGQTLQLELCTPCNDEPSILYAVSSIHLPNSTCKVASQTETKVIHNYSTLVNYTIVSEATNTCKLFLATSSYSYYINEAFYVELLSCPIGFTLQSGICDCDPVFSTYTDKCYIDYSAIEHSANTWITAYTRANNTEYLISDCPMDYCLPYSSKLNLLYPDLQCQFNRTGILCSQCQHPLSMVFGSSRCIKCNNLHIILIGIIIIMAGVVLVVLLYLLNLTVTNGTISGIILYANIVSINDSVFLVNENVFKPLRVFISFVNLDLGIEICFYNGMSSYAKKCLQLFFPFYLMVIAVSIIMISRYSSRILRLTYSRSLPVLATLFLLSYTGVLRTVLTVLFSYSTITYLPSGHQQLVWSIDASVPLFGFKFTILFITCLVLFLLLIPFNVILSTRYLLQFKMINRFKPLLDAFQGSYKDKYYYWVALHVTIRSFLFTMYAFQTRLKLILSTMLLMVFSIYSGYVHPHKNKLINIQELVLLLNLTIMYAVSYQSSERIFSIATNAMISLAFIQFFTIVMYHFLTYTCHISVNITLQTLKENLMNLCYKNHLECNSRFDVKLLNIPERTYNYTEYQDGLVSDDFK